MKKIFLLLVFLPCYQLQAKKIQGAELVNRQTLGFSVQQGIPFYKLPEGNGYNLTGVTAVFHQPLFKPKKTFVNLGIDIIPQLWLSYAHEVSVEAGINATVNLNVQIKKKSLLSFHAGSGFQYFGMHTARQAKGFAFANNFYAHYQFCFQKRLSEKKYSMGFLAGFRHLSNLSIQQPNTGLDNVLLGISFSRLF